MEECGFLDILTYVTLSVAQHKLFDIPTGPEEGLLGTNRIEGVTRDGIHPLSDSPPHDSLLRHTVNAGPLTSTLDYAKISNIVRDIVTTSRQQVERLVTHSHGLLYELQNSLRIQAGQSQLPWNSAVDVNSTLLQSALLYETNRKFTEFSSREQAEAVSLSPRRDTNIGLFMRTGSGKTLATQLCMSSKLCDKYSTLIYAVPYITLQRDIIQRTNELFVGIRAAEWQSNITRSDSLPQILVVVYETMASRSFLAWCYQHKDIVYRIVLDEAQVLIVDAGWRRTLRQVSHVQAMGVPLTIVAGIVTNSILKQLTDLLQPSSPFVNIGQSPDRTEIRYQAEELQFPSPVCCPSRSDFDIQPVVTVLQEHFERVRAMGPQHRLIVFVQSVEYAENLGREFDAPVCHAQKDLNLDDPLREWQLGTKRSNSIGIFATSVMGQGVDYPHVRLVIHLDLPNHLISYLQQTGRAGRDGQPAQTIFYHSPFKHVSWRLNRQISETYTIDDQQADEAGGLKELYHLIYAKDLYFQQAIGSFVGDSLASSFVRKCPIFCSRCDAPGTTWNTTPGQVHPIPPARQLPEFNDTSSRNPHQTSSAPVFPRTRPQWTPKGGPAQSPNTLPLQNPAPKHPLRPADRTESVGHPVPKPRLTVPLPNHNCATPPNTLPNPSPITTATHANSSRLTLLSRPRPDLVARARRFQQLNQSINPGSRINSALDRLSTLHQSGYVSGASAAFAIRPVTKHPPLAASSTVSQQRYTQRLNDSAYRLDMFKAAVLRLRTDTCLLCWISRRVHDPSHLWRADNPTSQCPYACSWQPQSPDPPPWRFRKPSDSETAFRLALPHGCWGCDMPMNLHHQATCINGMVQDAFKDVILPSVGLAWHFRRDEMLAMLQLERSVSFSDFRAWCMQPLPSDFLIGSWSNVHLAFEAAAATEQLVPASFSHTTNPDLRGCPFAA